MDFKDAVIRLTGQIQKLKDVVLTEETTKKTHLHCLLPTPTDSIHSTIGGHTQNDL